MALANLALMIPSVSDDSKDAVSNINERMQQLQKVLQYIPPDLNGAASGPTSPEPRRRFSLRRSPLSKKKEKKEKPKSPQSTGVGVKIDTSGVLSPQNGFPKSISPQLMRLKSAPDRHTVSSTALEVGQKQKNPAMQKSAFTFDGVDDTVPPRQPPRPPRVCEGLLYVQGTHGQWKKRWCRYQNRMLECRYEEKGSVATRIKVGYCMPEIQRMYKESKNDDLYWCYLESQQAYFCFKVFAPNRAYIFRAESGDVCTQFVDTITQDLEEFFPKDTWQKKLAAAQEINPLCREQFTIQMTNHQMLINSLSSSGFLQSYLPITSMNKEKSGVLGMETDDGWREYYFVLFEGQLYYYQDSKSTTPAGFVTLKFASVELDQKSLAQGNFVFHIVTPLRTVSCKARHSVALSEWVASLETSINREKKATKEKKRQKSSQHSLARRSSHDILANINQLLVNINTVEALCKNQTAVETFTRWLADRKADVGNLNHFMFYQDNEKLKSMSGTLTDGLTTDSLVSRADRMFHQYFSESSENQLTGLNKEILHGIQVALQSPTAQLYKEVEAIVYPLIDKAFAEFKKSSHFEKLTKKLTQKTVMDHRDVSEFPPDCTQAFLLKAKGEKRTREIKLSKRTNMVTIGRDKSNFVVTGNLSNISRFKEK